MAAVIHLEIDKKTLVPRQVARTQYIPQPPPRKDDAKQGSSNQPEQQPACDPTKDEHEEEAVAVVRLRACRDDDAVRTSLALFAAEGETRLVSLDCKGCRCLLEETLVSFLPALRRRLVSLDVTSQHHLGDRTLTTLAGEGDKQEHGNTDHEAGEEAAAGPALLRLEELLLAGCPKMTDAGVAAVARAAGGRLRGLSLTGLGGCSDASLAAVAEHCSRLTSLFLGGNDHITDQGIMALTSRCGRLRRLKIGGCRGVTDATVRYLEEHFPELAVLYFLGDASPRA